MVTLSRRASFCATPVVCLVTLWTEFIRRRHCRGIDLHYIDFAQRMLVSHYCYERYTMRSMSILIRCSLAIVMGLSTLQQCDAQNYDRLKVLGSSKYGTATALLQNHQNLTDITTDAQGNVYIVGYGFSGETTPGAFMTTHTANGTVFVAKFNPTLTTMLWGTYLAGNYSDCSGSIAVNSAGEVLITGTTASPSFPLTVASDQQYLSQSAACNFVAKLNPYGSQLVFSRLLSRTAGTTYHSTTNYGAVTAHASVSAVFDANGDIVVVGGCTTNFHTTANAYQSTNAGGTDCSLTKLSSNGTVLYSTYIGGTASDEPRRILSVGNTIYISGRTLSTSFPFVTNKPPDGSYDAFIMSWNNGTNPTPQAGYAIGGSGTEDANGLAYSTSTNSVLLCGYSSSSNFPWTAQLLPAAVTGGFVSSLSPGLTSLNFTTMIGATVRPSQVAARSNGDFYVVASMMNTSSLIPLSSTAIKSTSQNTDGVIIGSSPTGQQLRYGSFFGGSGYESCCALALNESSACGFRIAMCFDQITSKTDFPVSTGAYRGNNCDCFNTGMVVFGVSHPDTLVISQGTHCGEYLFSTSTSPTPTCDLSGVSWSFGDGTNFTTFSSSIAHIYQKNGTYHVTIRQIYGGTDTAYIDTTIVVKSQPVVSVNPKTSYICAKDSGAIVQASGAAKYIWSPGTGLSDSTIANPLIRPTKSMRYVVRGINPDGCFAEDTLQVYVVNVNAKLSSDTVICAGSSVSIKASGATSYSWYPANGLNTTKGSTVVATPQSSTYYHVVVSDAACVDTLHVRVGVSHAPRFVMNPGPILCTGGTTQLGLVLTAQDSLDTVGIRYAWTPTSTMLNPSSANPTVSPLKTTTYYCVVSNAFGCSRRDSVVVKVQNSLDLHVQDERICCRGGSIQLIASGGAQYSWSPTTGLSDPLSASPICSPLVDTKYTLISWSGDFGTATCRDTAFVHVRVYDFPTLRASRDTTVCPNSVVVLNCRLDSSMSDPTLRYEWRTLGDSLLNTSTAVDVSPISTTEYVCTARNADGCISRDTVRVTVRNILRFSINPQADVLPNQSFHLSIVQPQASITYTWYDAQGKKLSVGDNYYTKLDTSSWFYVHAQEGGCDAWDSIYVRVVAYAPVKACQARSACFGDSVLLYVVQAKTSAGYSWIDRDTTFSSSGDSIVVAAVKSTVYYVREQYGHNESTDSVALTVYNRPQVQVHDTTVCEGSTLDVVAEDSSVTDLLEWFDEKGTLVSQNRSLRIESAAARSYVVRARSLQGCTSTDTLLVSVMPHATVHLQLRGADTIFIGAPTQLWLEASADRQLNGLRIRTRVTMPAELLQSSLTQRIGSEAVWSIDTLVNLSQAATRIGTLDGMVLISHEPHVSVRLDNSSISLDTRCSSIREDYLQLYVKEICGADLMRLAFNDGALAVYPNPSYGDVIINSSEELSVVNSLGQSLVIESQDYDYAGTRRILRLRSLKSGVYLVRGLLSQQTRSFVVCD